jgi:hypothetical protein
MLGGLVMGSGKSAKEIRAANHKLNSHGFHLSIKVKFSTVGQALTTIADIKGCLPLHIIINWLTSN